MSDSTFDVIVDGLPIDWERFKRITKTKGKAKFQTAEGLSAKAADDVCARLVEAGVHPDCIVKARVL